jgi:hypothetical protein
MVCTHAPNDTTPRVVVPCNTPRGLSVPARSAQLVSSPTSTPAAKTVTPRAGKRNPPSKPVVPQITHRLPDRLKVDQTVIRPSRRIVRDVFQELVLVRCRPAKENDAVPDCSGINRVQASRIDDGVRVLDGFGAGETRRGDDFVAPAVIGMSDLLGPRNAMRMIDARVGHFGEQSRGIGVRRVDDSRSGYTASFRVDEPVTTRAGHARGGCPGL